MTRLIILILLFSVFVPCLAQEPCVMDLIKKQDTIYKNGEQKPYSGEYKEYYPGNIKTKGLYLNGLKHGEFKYYDQSLRYDSIVNYQYGKKYGLKETFQSAYFNNSGVYIDSRANYINDTIDGNSYRWLMGGQLEYSAIYHKGEIISSQYYPYNDSIDEIIFYIQGEHGGEISSDLISARDSIQIKLCGIIYGDPIELPYKCDTILLNNNYRIVSFGISGWGSDNYVSSNSCFITGSAKEMTLYNSFYIDVLIEAYGVQYAIPGRLIKKIE